MAMAAQPYLAASPERRGPGGFAQVQMTEDVLQHDDRVVDQNADAKRKGHHGHHIQGEAHDPHHHEGRDQRRGD